MYVNYVDFTYMCDILVPSMKEAFNMVSVTYGYVRVGSTDQNLDRQMEQLHQPQKVQ